MHKHEHRSFHVGAGGFLSHDLCFTGKDKTFDSAKSEIMIPPGRGMVRDRRDAIEYGREDIRILWILEYGRSNWALHSLPTP